MKKVLKYEYIKYKDIKSELLTTNNEAVEISDAFIENGIVCINGFIKQGFNGVINFDFMPSKYFPRTTVFGFVSLVQSGSDVNKVNFIDVRTDGNMHLWTSQKLNYVVNFTIEYPLRTS